MYGSGDEEDDEDDSDEDDDSDDDDEMDESADGPLGAGGPGAGRMRCVFNTLSCSIIINVKIIVVHV